MTKLTTNHHHERFIIIYLSLKITTYKLNLKEVFMASLKLFIRTSIITQLKNICIYVKFTCLLYRDSCKTCEMNRSSTSDENSTTKTTIIALANFSKKTTQNYNILKLRNNPIIIGIHGLNRKHPPLGKKKSITFF